MMFGVFELQYYRKSIGGYVFKKKFDFTIPKLTPLKV